MLSVQRCYRKSQLCMKMLLSQGLAGDFFIQRVCEVEGRDGGPLSKLFSCRCLGPLIQITNLSSWPAALQLVLEVGHARALPHCCLHSRHLVRESNRKVAAREYQVSSRALGIQACSGSAPRLPWASANTRWLGFSLPGRQGKPEAFGGNKPKAAPSWWFPSQKPWL